MTVDGEVNRLAWLIADAAAWGVWIGTTGREYEDRREARERILAEILALVKMVQADTERNAKR